MLDDSLQNAVEIDQKTAISSIGGFYFKSYKSIHNAFLLGQLLVV